MSSLYAQMGYVVLMMKTIATIGTVFGEDIDPNFTDSCGNLRPTRLSSCPTVSRGARHFGQVAHFRRDQYGRLIAIYPEGENGPATFRLSLPVDDHRTKEVLRELQRAGLSNWPGSQVKYDGKSCFRFDIRREYHQTDYRVAEYLWLQPEHHIKGGYVPGEAAFVVGTSDLDNTRAFALDDDQGVLVPNRVKELLERSGLHGVEFRPTVLDDDSVYPAVRVAWGGEEFGELLRTGSCSKEFPSPPDYENDCDCWYSIWR